MTTDYSKVTAKANSDKVLRSLDLSRIIAVETELSRKQGPQRPADSVANSAKAFSKTDGLVNSAGINRPALLDDADDDSVERLWLDATHTNFRGLYFLTRAALKHLSRDILPNIKIGSSVLRTPAQRWARVCLRLRKGKQGRLPPESGIYAGSTGVMEAYTQCWATELPRRYGCTVKVVAPGPVATGAVLAAPPESMDILRPMIDETPVTARLAAPEGVAWVVAMLCEDNVGCINGAYLPVSGDCNFRWRVPLTMGQM
ncbi:hypothetical protein CBER1_07393 [Cercospora berteroae]|uniref:Uncharacterized protein n=1 Tax=Cercospora berteroae TaxID=357750 RepID=A0A2S6CN00_9PEZI|nr:hypothetical protein CBER1_07393 [Cercospora berteroae]